MKQLTEECLDILTFSLGCDGIIVIRGLVLYKLHWKLGIFTFTVTSLFSKDGYH